MAAKRKLQAEIDICLKKVEEGLSYFHELWEKAHDENTTAQREKLASDLKKEIKKLQRHRESVKTWVQKHPDLLNKEPLIVARRRIEKEMERFKNFEKQVKTKAFSKLGLSIKKSKLSPEQQEACEFCQEQRDELRKQLQELDDELDKLQRKRSKKKNSTNSREEFLIKRIDKHKWHLQQLKDLSRRIEKGRVDPAQLNSVKDDILYYMEDSVQDEEFWDNDLLYEGIEELEVLDDEGAEESQPEVTSENNRSPSPPVVKKKKKKKKDKKEKKAKKKKKKEKKVLALVEEKPVPASTSPVLGSVSPATTVSVSHSENPSEPTPIVLTAAASEPKVASVPTESTSITTPETSARISTPRVPDFQSIMLEEERKHKKQKALKKKQSRASLDNVWAVGSNPFTNNPRATYPLRKTVKQNPSQNSFAPSQSQEAPSRPSIRSDSQPLSQPLRNETQATQHSTSNTVTSSTLNTVNANNASAFEKPFGTRSENESTIRTRITKSFMDMPAQAPKRVYFPRNPVRVPDCFPINPQPQSEDPVFVATYPIDTLFFMFHYSQGTHQQYLAAQELKKRSWRYHKKFLTWFQRHTEPKTCTADYEQGTYIYFDYESTWCQRVKNDFVFEYQHLEDSL